jgi:isoleucyl-tRNA synthetase
MLDLDINDAETSSLRQKSHLKLSPLEVRNVARKTAMEAIQDQREEFRQLGVMADWNSETETYRTMGKCMPGRFPIRR